MHYRVKLSDGRNEYFESDKQLKYAVEAAEWTSEIVRHLEDQIEEINYEVSEIEDSEDLVGGVQIVAESGSEVVTGLGEAKTLTATPKTQQRLDELMVQIDDLSSEIERLKKNGSEIGEVQVFRWTPTIETARRARDIAQERGFGHAEVIEVHEA